MSEEQIITRRIALRTKTTSPVDGSETLYDREIFFGDHEKSIYYKDVSGELHKFGSLIIDNNINNDNSTWSSKATKDYIDESILNLELLVIDDTSVTATTTWSSEKISFEINNAIDNIDLPTIPVIQDDFSGIVENDITIWSRWFTKNYIDTSINNLELLQIDDSTSSNETTWSSSNIEYYVESVLPTIPIQYRQISLNASSITPSPFNNAGCDFPTIVQSSNETYIWNAVEFNTNEVGFWNLSVPHDYTGNISDIIIIYESDESEEVTWRFDVFIGLPNSDPLTGAENIYDATFTNTSEAGSSRKLNINTINQDIPFFGSNNVNSMCSIKLTLTAGATTKPVKLYQIKLIYKA